MKKPFSYTERDPKVRCKKCGRGIKKNVIQRKSRPPDLCYACYLVEEVKVDPNPSFLTKG